VLLASEDYVNDNGRPDFDEMKIIQTA
jgi:hypothetical protein